MHCLLRGVRVTWRFWSFSRAHPDVEWQIWPEGQPYGDCLKGYVGKGSTAQSLFDQ